MKQTLFNPFVRIAGMKALLIGLVFLVLSSALAGILLTRFDGVLDIHFGGYHAFYVPFLDNLIDVCFLTLFFYLAGSILTKGRTRFIDILGTMTLARFPFVLAPLLNINDCLGKIGEKIILNLGVKDYIPLTTAELTVLIVISVLLILIVIWYVLLLYRAYVTSTNLKGANAVVSFIIALILAEITSSIYIHYLL